MGTLKEDLDEMLAPLLADYRAALDKHKHTHDEFGPKCKCGFRPRPMRYPRRSIGMHIRAAEKRADKAYDAAVKQGLAEREITMGRPAAVKRPLRITAWGRDERDSCERGTPGCSIDHTAEQRAGAVGETDCATW